MSRVVSAVCLTAAALAFLAAGAQADSMSVGLFGDAVSEDITGQLTVDLVSDGTTATFVFRNEGSITSSITAVYFGDALGTYLNFGTAYIDDSDGSVTGSQVNFSGPAHPGSVPVGEWGWSAGFSADASSPGPPNGVNNGIGEWVSVRFNLRQQAANTLYSLTELRAFMGGPTAPTGQGIGMHVQSIGADGESGWYGVVPEPTSIALVGLGLTGLVAARRRRRL